MNGLLIVCSNFERPLTLVAGFSEKWKGQDVIQASAEGGRNDCSHKYLKSSHSKCSELFISIISNPSHPHVFNDLYDFPFARKGHAAHINSATQMGPPTAGNPERKLRYDMIGSCSFHNPIESTCFSFENFADVRDRK
jgi:hypothetical protein